MQGGCTEISSLLSGEKSGGSEKNFAMVPFTPVARSIQDHGVMKTRPGEKENAPLTQQSQGYYFSRSRDTLAGFPLDRKESLHKAWAGESIEKTLFQGGEFHSPLGTQRTAAAAPRRSRESELKLLRLLWPLPPPPLFEGSESLAMKPPRACAWSLGSSVHRTQGLELGPVLWWS